MTTTPARLGEPADSADDRAAGVADPGPPSGTRAPVEPVDDAGQGAEIKPRFVVRTTIICLLFGLFGHVFLWIAYSTGINVDRQAAGQPPLGVWEAVVGVSIVGVALTAFGGFYAASLRARVAIAASFLLTFLVVLSYALTIRDFASATVGEASELVGDFRAVVITVVGFYFGSEAVVSAVKVYSVAKSNGSARDITRADRDLPTDQKRAGGPRAG